MRGHVIIATAVALSGLLYGCASEAGPSTEGGREYVRKADFTGSVMFYDPAVSLKPLTAEQMGDTTYAVPVQVVFYEKFAVAWLAPNGQGLVGQPDALIASWEIYEHAQATEGAVRPGEPNVTPETPKDLFRTNFQGPRQAVTPRLITPTFVVDSIVDADYVILDWTQEYEEVFHDLNETQAIHPGCL